MACQYVQFFSTLEGKEIILKGWKKAGICQVVDGSTVLPPDDPFKVTLNDKRVIPRILSKLR